MNYSFIQDNNYLGGNDFHYQTRKKSDGKDKSNYEMSNQKFGSYYLHKYSVDDYMKNLNHIGMSQQRNKDYYDDYVDMETHLKQSNLTNFKDRQQLLTRPFVTTGYMGAGETHIVNPDQYSRLMSGIDTKTKKGTSTLAGVSQDRFIPLVPCIAQNIQREEHIIPKYWVRGGESSRAHLQNVDYFKECGLK